LDRIDLFSRHFADRRHFAALNAPQAERSGDIAILIEGDWSDHAFVFDRLALFDELQSLGELVLAGVNDFAAGAYDLADRILDRCGVGLAGLGDCQAYDSTCIIRAVGRRVRGIEPRKSIIVAVEIFSRRRGIGAGRSAIGIVQILGADTGYEIRAVHAVIEQELGRPALRDPLPCNGGPIYRIADEIERIRVSAHG